MLGERHVQRSLWNTGTVTHLADKQVIAYQQRFLQRRRRYHIVLEEVQIHEIDSYQCEHNGIHPSHDTPYGRILRFLPPSPRNLVCDVSVEDERQHNQSQPTPKPHQENQIKHGYYTELYPLFTRGLYHIRK